MRKIDCGSRLLPNDYNCPPGTTGTIESIPSSYLLRIRLDNRTCGTGDGCWGGDPDSWEHIDDTAAVAKLAKASVKCECGGEVAGTTHSTWCPIRIHQESI